AQGYAVEKEVTLFIARRLGTLLRERMGAEVVLTRTNDRTLRVPALTARASAEGADLFISIPANASPRRALSGVETYYLNNTTDHATLRLASMENGGGPIPRRRGRTDLRYILSSLVQVGKMEESVGLATAVRRGQRPRREARSVLRPGGCPYAVRPRRDGFPDAPGGGAAVGRQGVSRSRRRRSLQWRGPLRGGQPARADAVDTRVPGCDRRPGATRC